MKKMNAKTHGSHSPEVRITARRVAIFAMVLLAAVVVAALGFICNRHRLERRAIVRFRELNADIGMTAAAPPWLARVLQACRLPLPRSIGGINDVDPEFCDGDLALLRNCTRIGNLDLDRTGVSDAGLPYLKHLTRLYILELGQTSVTDAGLVHLRTLPELRLLKLSGTAVTDAGLASLVPIRSLTWLILDDTRVTDEGLAHLAALPELERLDIKGTAVTPDGIASLKQALPDIEVHGP